MIKVKRIRQTIYTHLPTRFCTHCGSKGVYAVLDWEEDLYCLHCEASQPHTLYNPDFTLPALLRGEAEVIDRVETEEEITELEDYIERCTARLYADFDRSIFGV